MNNHYNKRCRHFGDNPFRGRGGFDDREDGRGGRFQTLPEHFGEGRDIPEGGFRTLPERPFDGEFRTMPERFDRGRAPGGPGFPRGGRPPFGGMPPHRPPAEFLKARVGEADLAELLTLAGRMARRRPEGDPAQGQNLVLSILAGREALTQRALQLMLGVQPGSLSELLTKLERKGLITREKAEDRRGNVLRITEAGRAAIPEADRDDGDDAFAALTAEQQAQLGELLRALLYDWISRAEPEPRGHRPPSGGGPQLV